jgi:hypothetical protein
MSRAPRKPSLLLYLLLLLLQRLLLLLLLLHLLHLLLLLLQRLLLLLLLLHLLRLLLLLLPPPPLMPPPERFAWAPGGRRWRGPRAQPRAAALGKAASCRVRRSGSSFACRRASTARATKRRSPPTRASGIRPRRKPRAHVSSSPRR